MLAAGWRAAIFHVDRCAYVPLLALPPAHGKVDLQCTSALIRHRSRLLGLSRADTKCVEEVVLQFHNLRNFLEAGRRGGLSDAVSWSWRARARFTVALLQPRGRWPRMPFHNDASARLGMPHAALGAPWKPLATSYRPGAGARAPREAPPQASACLGAPWTRLTPRVGAVNDRRAAAVRHRVPRARQPSSFKAPPARRRATSTRPRASGTAADRSRRRYARGCENRRVWPGVAAVLVKLSLDDLISCAAFERARKLVRRRGCDRIFELSYSKLLEAMRSAAANLGVARDEVTTHSCWHGGALSLFLKGTPARTIAQRGRWASAKIAHKIPHKWPRKTARHLLRPR